MRLEDQDRSEEDAFAEGGVGMPAHDWDSFAIDVIPPPPEVVGLSTDYLNHYGGILMLIAMVAEDPFLADELGEWAPRTYRAYFEASPLHWAPATITAFEALAPEAQRSFEDLMAATDSLVLGALAVLRKPEPEANAAFIATTVCPAIRSLLDRAAAFINSGGREGCEVQEDLQGVVDRLMACGDDGEF